MAPIAGGLNSKRSVLDHGIFLYRSSDYYNEIDIEIYNDSSGTIMYTTYAHGREANHVTTYLGFDPTAAFHEYRFDFYPHQVRNSMLMVICNALRRLPRVQNTRGQMA